jgi:hypothetical protein
MRLFPETSLTAWPCNGDVLEARTHFPNITETDYRVLRVPNNNILPNLESTMR